MTSKRKLIALGIGIYGVMLSFCFAQTEKSGGVRDSFKGSPSFLKDSSRNSSSPAKSFDSDQTTFVGGGSIPLDNGRGYPLGMGFFLWKQSAWPWPTTDFKLVFGGIESDVELTLRNLVTENIHLGFGMRYEVMKRFEEYDGGQIQIHQRFETSRYSGRIFLQQHLIANYVEIARVRGTYEFSYQEFSRDDETDSAFQIPNSGGLQTIKLNAGIGKMNPSNYQPNGWEFNLEGEATFRDSWRAWGPVNRWDSPSDYQKLRVDGTYVFSLKPLQQALVVRGIGGIGNQLDRLSAYRMGGSLKGHSKTLQLHGFYLREILAQDFALINLDYTWSLLAEQELALHFYLDGALTRRGDITDDSAKAWSGTGAGISFCGPRQSQWLMGYGYGINAPRNQKRGGHEIFGQFTISF